MADSSDPKLFEIVGSQLWQDALVDLVIAKGLLAAFKPEPPQPSPYVHRVVPMCLYRRIVRPEGNAQKSMMAENRGRPKSQKGQNGLYGRLPLNGSYAGNSGHLPSAQPTAAWFSEAAVINAGFSGSRAFTT
jgi:hypothetical protein